MNRRVVVTGASEGIGRAFCHRLAREGFEILAVARNEDRLRSLMGELQGLGHSYLVCDLSDRAGLERLTSEIRRGPYHGLVNNAGYGLLRPFVSESLENWKRMIDLNVQAVVELSHVFLGQARRDSFLINVSSTLSMIPMPIQSVYSATKAFVTAFTEALWFQERSRGVTVINLCPGITATEFNVRAGGSPNKLPRSLTQSPEEVVEIAWKSVVGRKGPTVVSGWKNRVVTMLPRLLSRKHLTWIMGRVRQ